MFQIDKVNIQEYRMPIAFHGSTKEFHLYNDSVSYIMTVLENGHLGQLYAGKRLPDQEDFSHMLQLTSCVLAPCTFPYNMNFSLEIIKQEYPCYGSGDYRTPAFQIRESDGSRISDFRYVCHEIYKGKPMLEDLPASFGDDDFTTLEILMHDQKTGCDMILSYHIHETLPVLTRDTKFINGGETTLALEKAMSFSLDLPDMDYEMVQLDGAWSRERHVHSRKLQYGSQNISSSRGASSANHNPFLALKRPNADELSGEVFGLSLVYSGNFLAEVECDSYDVTRMQIGINPFEFEWVMEPGESFQTPEAILVYSDKGLSGMSQSFHRFFRNNLMRSSWARRERPILINNWEATVFDFTEDSLIPIASKAKDLGVELFVLDDGWFGKRNDDCTSLGDWFANPEKLPNGIKGISERIRALGLKFGLWFEPEMVNEESELFRKHPEYTIGVPGRSRCHGRNQYVLDFANPEVVDYIYDMMYEVLDGAEVSYIKWDMNRNITEAYSSVLPPERQKEFFHRYILGVYSLYEKLMTAFPEILFESCASGGGRFDPGMLYYAPQTWTSDDTDAVERLKIQYGTSMVYPLISMGSHVSACPNHQVDRTTPLQMRADVAYFGTFGYELDATKFTPEEEEAVRNQIAFFKNWRETIHFGDFYRLQDGKDGRFSWMCVSESGDKAIVAYYQTLSSTNPKLKRVRLSGLDENAFYRCLEDGRTYSGAELMHFGMMCIPEFTGLGESDDYRGIWYNGTDKGDFRSRIFTFERV